MRKIAPQTGPLRRIGIISVFLSGIAGCNIHYMNALPDILAVDGGGTRCRVACVLAGEKHLVEAGSANASTDIEGTLAEVRKGLGRLADRIGLELDDLRQVPTFIGLAGVVSPEIALRVAKGLPLDRVRVEDDRPASVRAALGSGDGATAHCGTGSFFAIQRGGAIRLSGGWGSILGDEASAQWLGRKALLATLDVADGLRRESDLSTLLLQRFGSSAGIVAFAAKATPADFGALAPLVTEAETLDDNLATDLLQRGADHIARTLIAMGWDSSLPICLTGGMASHYGGYLPQDMRINITSAKGEPIDGALSLARDFADEVMA